MTKNRKIDRGVERCRNFRNLYLSLPDARPVPAKVDPLQADVAATKWAAPSSLSRAGESRKRGRTSQLDPSDKAVGRAQPPHPNPLPQGEREPEVPSSKGVTAISTALAQALGQNFTSPPGAETGSPEASPLTPGAVSSTRVAGRRCRPDGTCEHGRKPGRQGFPSGPGGSRPCRRRRNSSGIPPSRGQCP